MEVSRMRPIDHVIGIGNAVINDETDIRGMSEYFASHVLISDEIEAEIQKECIFIVSESEESEECQVALGTAEYDTRPIDIYAIYAPICQNTNLTAKPKKPSSVIDPCSEYYTIAHMNRPDVQKALSLTPLCLSSINTMSYANNIHHDTFP
ncbi:hypothetical protein RND71_007437 [Anisodus tanguticus]|uniref:Uncharacterized protein n=1 Tax=Anisodus tanguticus TaxID=243964 RepID=A0AAE1VJ51_9SOLA|nr:hypothetical protein RND71_007437 [Anisodus tanguticus]